MEEIEQKEGPAHLEKGQFILYTTQPLGGIAGKLTGNLPNSPAAMSLYSQKPTKIYTFNNNEKPNSSYLTRPFRKLNALTPKSGMSYESSKYRNFKLTVLL